MSHVACYNFICESYKGLQMLKTGLLDNIHIPKTRRLILLALKEHGRLTADQLAEMLAISAVAVRRHLDNLRHADLVSYEEVQRGVGRPGFEYFLTPKADNLFPRNYQELAADVILTVRDMYGKEAVDAIFKKRSNKIAQVYQPLISGSSLEERVEQLVELRQEDGYMASWQKETDGSITITEHNCPIQHVASECAQACHEDLALFANLLNADVIRLKNQANGDATCTYKIMDKRS